MAAQTSENWDDDFEFSQSNSSNSPNPKHSRKPDSQIGSPEPRLSLASSHFSEDWDADDGSKRSSPTAPVVGTSRTGVMGGISSRLDNWAEAGPSTPTKHAHAQGPTENWDDDFEDKGDSPPGRRHHHVHRASHHTFQNSPQAHALRTRHSYHTPPRPRQRSEPENWDDDFDDPMDPTSSTSPSKTDNDNTPVTKRTRQQAYADSSDEEEGDFGFPDDREEDKTVTARSRTAPLSRAAPLQPSSPPPPVPALPHALSPALIEPFPRSPTVSVFSIPTTSGRNSVAYFNSSSHLVLSGAASSLGMLPPSPPTQRERRRLRKKSRPPNMDNNVFELIEEPLDSSPPPLPPSTPERERASSPPTVPMMPPSSLEATPSSGGSKTPLLSRIGSVKKWGVRRKRASTGPAEVMMHDFGASTSAIVEEDGTPRPPSSLEQTLARTPSSRHRGTNHTGGGMRAGWFFRPGGAHSGAGSPPPGHAELKHEKSLDQARLRPGAGDERCDAVPTTPSKCGGRLSRRKPSGMIEYTSSGELTGDGSSSASGAMGLGKPPSLGQRRPTSMQVPNSAVGTKFGSVGTRHASYGSSVGRASAARVFSTPTPTESAEELPPMPALPLQEGSRSFMGSVRKISLVTGKKHKTRTSSVDAAQMPPLPSGQPLQDETNDEEGGEAEGDARMETVPRVRTPELLPPIELHPPSPPRAINGMSAVDAMPLHISDGLDLMMPSISAPAAVTLPLIGVSISPVSVSKAALKTPGSPQSASLGRTAQAPLPPPLTASVPRRNSLGDLKIPARISQAQIGLKRDLGMVREFANSIDRLKELQSTYSQLVAEVQTFLETTPPSRATSPTVFSLVRPRSRLRSHTSSPANASASTSTPVVEHKYVATTLHTITVKYRVSWECAELLIELGGGAPYPTSPPASGVSSTLSPPSTSMQAELDRRKNRERAITLSGEESKAPAAVPVPGGATTSTSTSAPPDASWRASTGRHDLSQRQLVLLRDMLSGWELPPDDAPLMDDGVNRNWRWGDGMSSTVTLPSEESGSRGAELGEGGGKKKRRGRMGLTGLRDMLRMLKRSRSEQQRRYQAVEPVVPPLPVASTASLSTDSSHYSQQHHYPHGHLEGGAGQRAANTSTELESVRAAKETTPANSPYGGGGPALHHKASPRRPSLASIFRLGQKSKGGTSSAGESSQDSRSDVRSASRGSNTTGGDEEDWDRVESAIDLDTAAKMLGIEGTATIKGRKGRASSGSEHPLQAHAHVLGGPTPGGTHRPVTPRRGHETAQVLRLEAEASPRSIRPMRSTRLSNVEEVEDGDQGRGVGSETKATHRVSLPRTSPLHPNRPPSRGGMGLPGGASVRTGSVRSAPPQPVVDDAHVPAPAREGLSGLSPEIKLAMTPENIGPLLENAKEVHVRCHECIRELRALVEAMPAVAVASPASVS